MRQIIKIKCVSKNFKMRLFNLFECRLIKYKYECLELAMHITVGTESLTIHTAAHHFFS